MCKVCFIGSLDAPVIPHHLLTWVSLWFGVILCFCHIYFFQYLVFFLSTAYCHFVGKPHKTALWECFFKLSTVCEIGSVCDDGKTLANFRPEYCKCRWTTLCYSAMNEWLESRAFCISCQHIWQNPTRLSGTGHIVSSHSFLNSGFLQSTTLLFSC